jgi:site-specific recombinase XerD
MKRRNYSPRTVRNYMNNLKHFTIWLSVPIETVSNKQITQFIDFLHAKRLAPKTINCYLQSIRGFYDYLYDEEGIRIPNPVKKGYALKEPKPLPRYLRDQEVDKLFSVVDNARDIAIFKLMLRCGLRVQEVAELTLSAVYLKRRSIHIKKWEGW